MTENLSGSRSAVLLISSIVLTLTSVGVALGVGGSLSQLLVTALFTLGTAVLAAASYRWAIYERQSETKARALKPAPVRVRAGR